MVHCEVPKLVSEARVGDADQRFGTLTQRSAAKMGDAVLGDDFVDIGARTYDAGSGIEHGDDPGNRALLGGGRKGDNRSSAPRAEGASDEVGLPSSPLNGTRPMESAQTCPVRSTWMAELIATIRLFWAMTKGSFTSPVG
jgi:hypothetical protein